MGNDMQDMGTIVNAEMMKSREGVTPEIKSCPFCGFNGGNECIQVKIEDELPFYAVCCADCFMRGPRNADYKKAIEGWNSIPSVENLERLNKEIKSLREIENGLTEDNFSLSSQYVEDNKKIAQLEKEADWLANKLADNSLTVEVPCEGACNPCELDCRQEQWREAARNAIAQGSDNDSQ